MIIIVINKCLLQDRNFSQLRKNINVCPVEIQLRIQLKMKTKMNRTKQKRK